MVFLKVSVFTASQPVIKKLITSSESFVNTQKKTGLEMTKMPIQPEDLLMLSARASLGIGYPAFLYYNRLHASALQVSRVK